MGRIQRKKTTKKSKKKTLRPQQQSTAPSVAVAKTAAPGMDLPKILRKKKAFTSKVAVVSRSAGAARRTGYWGQAAQFLREVKVELKKVTWPSRKQAIGSTVVVIILVMIIAFFLGIADMGLSSIVRFVLQQ